MNQNKNNQMKEAQKSELRFSEQPTNFWQKLPKSFLVLAPMADVTDPAFRRIIAKYGKPDVLWTEFVSADGLAHEKARPNLLRDLAYTEGERPIVAQLFSAKPETMRAAAKLCAELGFDGIDINMGCPDKSIEKQGAGAAMIKTPEVAISVIAAAKEGIRDAGKTIPLSVKTRIGYNKNEIETWLPVLLKQDLAAITVHCRTRKEMSSVPAHWEEVRRAVELRDAAGVPTLIIGNGDVMDTSDAQEKAKKYGCDGVMIGRAIFGNPWLFSKSEKNKKNKSSIGIENLYYRLLQVFGKKNKYWLRNKGVVSKEEKLQVMVEHSKLFEELLGDSKSFSIMKKHFKAYVHGWPGARELRQKLFDEAHTAADVEKIVKAYISTV